jgi:hypothetical protein
MALARYCTSGSEFRWVDMDERTAKPHCVASIAPLEKKKMDLSCLDLSLNLSRRVTAREKTLPSIRQECLGLQLVTKDLLAIQHGSLPNYKPGSVSIRRHNDRSS